MIESKKNQLVKTLNALSKKKERDRLNVFIVEGERFVSEIPENWDIKYYVLSESFINKHNNLRYNTDVYVVKDYIFESISDTNSPQGIIAVVSQKKFPYDSIDDILLSTNNPLFIIADTLLDPGNIGSIIRTADAFALDGVFLSHGCVDIYNPKVLRATMGSIFHLPIVANLDLDVILNKFKQHNIKIIGTYLNSDCYLHNLNLMQSCALIIGNETHGLSELAASYADFLVKIPMLGNAESLNASVAASVAMYECIRQRFLK